MAKYNQNKQPSDELVATATKMAKATQKPGQTKEQTKLIAQGIQKGIEQYKKQHKVKVREQDKQKKKRQSQMAKELPEDDVVDSPKTSYLPWWLLGFSWLGFVAFVWLKP